ncbi:hypothetical protein F5148DRAFT_252374 [Russula earlei]|uniref:Uncharacterized protein n=1 Tax=Russula earlei TaxID=71964 RepID=A0ACC0U5K1_9AGAM|nr:hypothetical protein F5148DRAFT_252374 [Russula earlei]
MMTATPRDYDTTPQIYSVYLIANETDPRSVPTTARPLPATLLRSSPHPFPRLPFRPSTSYADADWRYDNFRNGIDEAADSSQVGYESVIYRVIALRRVSTVSLSLSVVRWVFFPFSGPRPLRGPGYPHSGASGWSWGSVQIRTIKPPRCRMSSSPSLNCPWASHLIKPVMDLVEIWHSRDSAPRVFPAVLAHPPPNPPVDV